MKKFKCTKCGLCCEHLEKFFDIYKELDRGDGVCRYYDQEKKLCGIYDNRPLKCNIEKSYSLIFKEWYSEDEYYALIQQGCEELQKGD